MSAVWSGCELGGSELLRKGVFFYEYIYFFSYFNYLHFTTMTLSGMDGLLSVEVKINRSQGSQTIYSEAKFRETKFFNLLNKGNTHRSPSSVPSRHAGDH